MTRFGKIAILTGLIAFGPVALEAASFINSFVGVCDPSTPANCIKPNADGSITTEGGTLPAGAATSALQTSTMATNHTDLAALLTGPLTVNTHAVTQSGTWNVGVTGNVAITAATLPLPSGAATSALQTTMNTTLGSPFQAGGSIGNTSFAATQATASSLNAQVVGTVASGSADSGNPVKVGGKYNVTLPTLTDGQRGDLQLSANGAIIISGVNGIGGDGNAAPVLLQDRAATSRALAVGSLIYNGTNWDRIYSASAANATTGTGVQATGALGKYNSTFPTYTDGQYGNLQLGTRGSVRVELWANDSAASTPSYAGASSDGVAASNVGLYVNGMTRVYNGTTWDRLKGDTTNGLYANLQASSAYGLVNSADGTSVATAALGATSFPKFFNSASWDRARDIVGQIGNGGTGQGVGAIEEAGQLFANITTATTTTVKSGAGVLHTVCINTDTASATITIYNNTAGSGAKIGTITNPAALLSMGPICAKYDIYFGTGLTLVTTGTQDITVTYR